MKAIVATIIMFLLVAGLALHSAAENNDSRSVLLHINSETEYGSPRYSVLRFQDSGNTCYILTGQGELFCLKD